MEGETFSVRIPFGMFSLDGSWKPNPLLKMSAVDQLKWNMELGVMGPEWQCGAAPSMRLATI